jgi:L-threonylcarbamoyladenylate synthase
MRRGLWIRTRNSRSCAAKKADTGLRTNETFHLTMAANVLRAGGIVAHATEAVWGLACDPFDADAVTRVLQLKNRSISKGLIVIGADESDFAPEIEALNEFDAARVRRTWPGPETWLIPNVRFPAWITGGRATVAVRVPGHSQARALCGAFGGPLVSTSANPSNRQPARTELAVRRYFADEIDYVLHGNVGGEPAPSRIREATSGARLR